MKPEPETQPCSKSESTDGSDSNFRPSLEEILTEKKMVGCWKKSFFVSLKPILWF